MGGKSEIEKGWEGEMGEAHKEKEKHSLHSMVWVASAFLFSTLTSQKQSKLCHILKKLFRGQIMDNTFE